MDDPTEPMCPVEPATGEQPYPITVPADDHPIAVVLDFVNPLRPFRYPFGDAARFDEAGGIMPRGGYAPQHGGGLIPETCAGVDSDGTNLRNSSQLVGIVHPLLAG